MDNAPLAQFANLSTARSLRTRMLIVFGLQGVVCAMLNMRIPDLQLRIGLSDSELGFVLMGGPLGALIAFPIAAATIARVGTRIVMGSCFAALSMLAAIATLSTSGPLLFLAMIGVGAMNSLSDIAINVEADRVEAATGGRLMNRCHGVWSLVFFASSMIAGLIRGAGYSPEAHLWTLFPIYGVAVAAFILPMTASPPRGHVSSGKAKKFVLPTVAILALAAFGIGGDLFEGASRVWATIYLRDGFDVSPFVEGAALPALILTMAACRLSADRLVQAYGPVLIGRVALVFSISGVGLILFAPSASIAILGFAVAGVGIAPVYPLMISSAARIGDRPAAENVASMALVFQLIMLTSPMLIGFVAETYSVRLAYGTLLPLLALGFVMAGRLK